MCLTCGCGNDNDVRVLTLDGPDHHHHDQGHHDQGHHDHQHHGQEHNLNTAGVGVVPAGVDIRPERAAIGDVIIVSGPIGVHGIAIMSVREGPEFGTQTTTDSAAPHPLVADGFLGSCAGALGIPENRP